MRPRTLTLVLLVLCILQLFLVLLVLGLGQTAASFIFSTGVELVFYGVLQLVWREDLHLSCLKPWSRSFCLIAVLHVLYDGGLFALKENKWNEPRARDIEHMCEIAPWLPASSCASTVLCLA